MAIENLITEHIDTWTSAVKTKATTGRGSSKKLELYGIKKLRELILELAVRGKLVPQDPNDEPVSVLLERIAQKKAQLVKDKLIKKPKNLPEIEEQKPFSIPDSWEWSQLGYLTNYGVCDKAENTDVESETWVLELEDVEKETSKLLKKVRFSERNFKSSKNIFKEEDVIYGKLRPYLDKVLIADEAGVCTTEMIPVRAYGDLTSGYLRLVMKSPYFIKYANDSTHGMNLPRMGTDKARAALFPMAPLEEQHRIVTKVNELMTLCDQLERQTEASIEAHQLLVTTLLDTLTNSADATELMQNWERISEHFDTLFTTEESIDQLKQTILQLAVMGKLVPQDPNDEPAAKLLERIAEEKAQLIKEKKIKKQKALPPITDDEKPFELPSGWEWCRLGELGYDLGGGTPSKANASYWGGDIPWVSPKDMKRDLIDSAIDTVTEKAVEETTIKLIPNNSLLMVVRGMILAHSFPVALTKKPLVINQDMKALVFSQLHSDFLLFAMKAMRDSVVGLVDHSSHGTCKLVSEKLWALPFAIPPYREQKNITNMVNEFLAICDELKLRLGDIRQTQLQLTDAIVEQAM